MPPRRTSDSARILQLACYHRPQQFAWRLWRRTQALWERAGWNGRPLSSTSGGFKRGAADILCQMANRRLTLWPARNDPVWLAGIASGRFCFLNTSRDLVLDGDGRGTLGTEQGERSEESLTIDWRPNMPQLWRFHLQCQEYLLALAAHHSSADAWALVKSWLADDAHREPRAGADAWHPFCISRRLPVWLMLAAIAPPAAEVAGQFWIAVDTQTFWLRRHLEWDLGGNHLLDNLRALALVERLVEGVDRVDGDWLIRQIRQQLAEQISPSGEHCERAPSYHALMQLAVLEIGAANQFAELPLAEECFEVAQHMATWLSNVVHPDGQVPLLGDSTLDEAPSPTVLCEAVGVSISAQTLNATHDGNYWCWRSETDDFLIVDAGPVACDHLPAHGHADLLTLEASLAGQRVFIDAGTLDYEDSEMRQYCRGTSAHNTLQIDGADHCDLWSRFRMGRRGRPIFAQADGTPSFCWFSAAHDAYTFLGMPWTARFVAAAPGPVWIIIDWASGKGDHALVSRLRLHPHVELQRNGDEAARLFVQRGVDRSGPDGPHVETRQYQLKLLGEASLEVEPGWYCPSFGDRRAIDVMTGRTECWDRHWLGWILHPVQEAPVIEAGFRGDEFDICLPDGHVVALPTRKL